MLFRRSWLTTRRSIISTVWIINLRDITVVPMRLCYGAKFKPIDEMLGDRNGLLGFRDSHPVSEATA
jgi:hypothetical protein